jgi:hypothetical protein
LPAIFPKPLSKASPMDKQREAMMELLDIILTLVEVHSTKPFGLPGGELYAHLMVIPGMGLDRFEAIMGALVTVGQVKKANQCYLPGPNFKKILN